MVEDDLVAAVLVDVHRQQRHRRRSGHRGQRPEVGTGWRDRRCVGHRTQSIRVPCKNLLLVLVLENKPAIPRLNRYGPVLPPDFLQLAAAHLQYRGPVNAGAGGVGGNCGEEFVFSIPVHIGHGHGDHPGFPKAEFAGESVVRADQPGLLVLGVEHRDDDFVPAVPVDVGDGWFGPGGGHLAGGHAFGPAVGPGQLHAAVPVEQDFVVLGEIGDAEKVLPAVAVQIHEADQAVAAHIGRSHVPFDEVFELAGEHVEEPHAAVRLDADFLDSVVIQVRAQQSGKTGIGVEVVPPALYRCAPLFRVLEERDVPVVLVGRIPVHDHHHLLVLAVREEPIGIEAPGVGHGVHVVGPLQIATIQSHDRGGAEGLGSPAGLEEDFHLPVAIQVGDGHNFSEV